jgi:hypothetical protein
MEFWRWNSAETNSPPRQRFLPPQGLRHGRHGTILQVSPELSFCGHCHDSSTFLVRKKALGLWIKTD